MEGPGYDELAALDLNTLTHPEILSALGELESLPAAYRRCRIGCWPGCSVRREPVVATVRDSQSNSISAARRSTAARLRPAWSAATRWLPMATENASSARASTSSLSSQNVAICARR